MKKLLPALSTIPKSGNEKLTVNGEETGYSLLNFWQWSVSDLVSNATRGRLAEFIVGSGMGFSPVDLRTEWAPFDLLIDRIRIEVKSAAYIQSWGQDSHSSISFSIKEAQLWNNETGCFEEEAGRHSDVYVFCLLHHREQETIDPLKLEQWQFYVLPTYRVNNYSKRSVSLIALQQLTDAVLYQDLNRRVHEAYAEQELQQDSI